MGAAIKNHPEMTITNVLINYWLSSSFGVRFFMDVPESYVSHSLNRIKREIAAGQWAEEIERIESGLYIVK